MKTYLDCYPCFIRQSLDAVRMVTDKPEVHLEVVRQVIAQMQQMNLSASPPQMGQKIHRLIRELTGVKDPYFETKKRFNNAAMKLYPKMRQLVLKSADKLQTAVRLAVAGNIIDFGVNGSLKESELEKTIDECLETEFFILDLNLLQQAVKNANEILYLADNAGELVFDRLLIEQLPFEKITLVVKGSPVINDATIEDARIAGLTKIIDVIDNGSDAPGTILKNCSQSFRECFNKADLIIAKGQGNYETLSDADKNIFFLLKAKCPVISRHIGCEVGDMILQKTKAFKGDKDAGI